MAAILPAADRTKADLAVVLQRLEDRPLGLRERARLGVRRLGQRARERGHEEVDGVLVERERARLARGAHDAARRAREADEVLLLAARSARRQVRRETRREQQLEAERERVRAA